MWKFGNVKNVGNVKNMKMRKCGKCGNGGCCYHRLRWRSRAEANNAIKFCQPVEIRFFCNG